MANEPISYDRQELRSIIRAFKAMDDQAVEEAKRESNALAQYAANEVEPIHSQESLDNPLSIASQMALGLANHPRLASSLTDLLLSVSLVEHRLKHSGQVTSSDLIVTHNSLNALPVKVEEILAISSIQPFARFSLN